MFKLILIVNFILKIEKLDDEVYLDIILFI